LTRPTRRSVTVAAGTATGPWHPCRTRVDRSHLRPASEGGRAGRPLRARFGRCHNEMSVSLVAHSSVGRTLDKIMLSCRRSFSRWGRATPHACRATRDQNCRYRAQHPPPGLVAVGGITLYRGRYGSTPDDATIGELAKAQTGQRPRSCSAGTGRRVLRHPSVNQAAGPPRASTSPTSTSPTPSQPPSTPSTSVPAAAPSPTRSPWRPSAAKSPKPKSPLR